MLKLSSFLDQSSFIVDIWDLNGDWRTSTMSNNVEIRRFGVQMKCRLFFRFFNVFRCNLFFDFDNGLKSK
jgi:hypothetical protein